MAAKRKKKPKRKSKVRGRPEKGTPDWAPEFLKGLIAGLHVRDACEAAGVDGSMPYARRIDDLEFAKAWAEAKEIGTEELEAEAQRRAFHGTLKPVFHKGEHVGNIREYSDTLIQFLLKGRLPNKYRDNSKIEHTGKDGSPIAVDATVSFSEELESLGSVFADAASRMLAEECLRADDPAKPLHPTES